MPPDRRRLLYRAQHRGFKEADIVIGQFAAAHLAGMTAAEVAAFEALLEVPDQELYAWIIGRSEAPENYRGPMLDRLRGFDVAGALAGQ